jgi:hypothetical protein
VEHRFDSPTFRRRRDVICASQMHTDAVAICLLARKLDSTIDDFMANYDRDECLQLFAAAKCDLPSDETGKVWDENQKWSNHVYGDISGFSWSLEMFLSIIEGNLDVPDAVVVDQEEVLPMVVVG